MPRDPRNYITVHNGLTEHPKVEPLTDGAFRLLIESWCYCDRNNTDGKISGPVWQKRGTRKARTELVLAGLVEQTEDGVVMHDYAEHQRTAAEKADTHSKRVLAGRAGGLAKSSNALATATAPAKQTSSKNVAELELEEEELEVSSSRPRKRAKHDIPEDWQPNEAHLAKARELNVNTRGLADAFRSHHIAKGSQFVSWDHAFFTWIHNAAKFDGGRPGARADPPRIAYESPAQVPAEPLRWEA